MAEFSATDAAIEGIRLAGRKPGAILVWSVAQFLFSLIAGAVLVTLVGPEMQAMSQADPAAASDPAQALAALNGYMRVNGVMLLLYLPWGAVMASAVYRALLRPADRGLGYLRLGADELRLIGLALLVALFATVVMFAALIVDIILVAIFGALSGALGLSGAGKGVNPVDVLIGVVGAAAPVAALFWALVRISLAGPMTFSQKRLRLLESWKLTRGHFWPLFGTYAVSAVLFVITLLLGMALAVIIGGLVTGQGFVPAWQSFSRPDYGSLQAWFTVPHLVMIALNSLYGGLCAAIINAPAAAAYRMLADDANPATASAVPEREPTGPWG